MTRDSYVMRLHSQLGQLPSDRRKEVLEDINRHFIEGAQEGMSEEALAERLGDPETLAREYIEAFGGERRGGVGPVEPTPTGFALEFLGRQPYNPSWSLAMPDEPSLNIEVSSVDTRVDSYDGDTLDARFEGFRVNARDDYPRIEASCSPDGTLLVRQVNWNDGQWGGLGLLWLARPMLKGTLTVRVPKAVMLKEAVVKNSSGDIGIETLSAGQTALSASSGDITARGVAAGGTLSVRSSSGDIELERSACASLEAEVSSGDLTVSEVDAGRARLKSNSGGQSIKRLTAELDVEAESSSGDIKIAEVSAGTLRVKANSGGVRMDGVNVKGICKANTVSGSLHAKRVVCEEARLGSSSGGIKLDEADVGSVEAGAASGSVTLRLVKAVPARVGTSSGSVSLTVPRGSGIKYSFSTASGSMRCGAEQTIEAQGRGGSRGTIGSGETPVSVSTASGSFKLEFS
ncbi:MAG: DUF4097 family beta strand repeat-containing protein [Oscillospiraceae bacterium]|jgi:DUF4097 and DUF4098 domain-containing protein YvlB|nr:DUF4097 family beta strand repeat-containing protein [Oscillospiraceae bacterium]